MWKIFSVFKEKRKVKNITKLRTAIMGGSFDPVHNGHTLIVRKLLERFDKVIIVPAKISPFKLDRDAVDGSDRLSMLRLAFADITGVEISDFELKNGGISYSYLTAQNFAQESTALSYVIGSEMVKELSRWKNFDQLKRLTSFYVVPREGYTLDEGLLDSYDRMGVNVKIADFSCQDISSAMIKVDMAFDRAASHLDQRVYDYIKKYKLYEDYFYITRKYSEFGMKAERIEHTYRAVKEGIRLAKIHGINVEKAVTALLLHDIGKNITKKELIKKYKIANFSFDEKMPETCHHAPIGAAIARHCFGVQDEDILAAIRTHTTCAPFMDDLQKVVAIADYIEEGRSFDGISQIRDAAHKDLNLCMEIMLKNMIKHLKQKSIYKTTIDAYDYFRMINSQDKLL